MCSIKNLVTHGIFVKGSVLEHCQRKENIEEQEHLQDMHSFESASIEARYDIELHNVTTLISMHTLPTLRAGQQVVRGWLLTKG